MRETIIGCGKSFVSASCSFRSGILVQLHILFLLFAGWMIVTGFAHLAWTLTWLVILWGSILLHEDKRP